MDKTLWLSPFLNDFDGQVQKDSALILLGKHVSINGQLALAMGLPEQLSHRLHQSIAGGLPSTGRARMALVDTRLRAFSSGISETVEKYLP